jgi:hypothetical protein
MPQVDLKNQLIRMNLDDSFYYLAKTDYVDALNITHDAQEQSEDIINTNITGNRLIPYNLPTGTNATIGAKSDILRNRVFEFIWNSNNKHSIVIYDRITDTRTKLIENLTDSNNVDILQFTRTNKIIHADIIYRSEDEGDLLFYTDGNVSPRKLNVKHIQDGIYGTLEVPFIELAKMPPRSPIIAAYGNDATRNSNSLRKKLLMATYRWSYDDFEKSTFTTYSKIPLPIGYYGSDNDITNTNNNFVTLTVETGNKNVTDIEIAVRFNIDGDWANFLQIIVLNKVQLGIADNITYQYLFYNDAVYPPIADVEIVNNVQVIPLFDWVPQKANSQVCGNGNTIELGAITEDYDNYPISQLDITMTAANETNIPPDTDPAALTYTTNGTEWIFSIGGTITTGTLFKVLAFIPGSGVQTFITYTSVGGDTPNSVAIAITAYILANWPLYYDGTASFNHFYVLPPVPGFFVTTIQVDLPGGSGISTEKTWLWDANYINGLGYKDDQGRLMPGVTTFVNPVDSNNDFLVTTPSFSLAATLVQTPVISASINHLPPEGAVSYAWARRRMTYQNFLMYETCDYQDGSDGYLYFCLANIEVYHAANSQFIYGTAPITSTSRIKIIAGVTSGNYNGDIWNQDYEIIGTVTKTLTGGSSPADDRVFIKIVKPTTVISPAYTVNMLVMVYTPMENPTDIANSVYWEWGEEYGIYAIGNVNYHRGQTQDQTASQPALFVWPEGDVYFHQRVMDKNIVGAPTSTPTTDTLDIMDANWSDFFLSAVNDNGRGLTIEVNAHKTFFPATIRFSREYQQNTSINQTNRFLFDNFIDLDRSYGSIDRMEVFERVIRIGQQFKIGAVPIFNQISKDAGNNTLTANTDVLLNPVQYYEGNFGVGDAPEAWVTYNYATYFFDTNRGVWCRLSRDGVIPISILYKLNSWCNQHGVLRGSTYKIYGTYDPKANNCIFAFEATDTDPAFTVSFDEQNNAYESFLSYMPEFMMTLGSLLITYKNGNTWTHDGDLYNNFYGVQYGSSCSIVYNDKSAVKKKFLAVGYKSLNNIVWASPTNGDVQTSMVNPQTNLQQISNLIENDYELEETTLCAALNFDANSMEDAREAVVVGDYLNGNWILIKFVCDASKAGQLINMSQPYITWEASGRNF